MKNKSAVNTQIAEEAAEWALRIHDNALNTADRRKLAEWLKRSPVHVEELLIASSILAGVEQGTGTACPDIAADIAADRAGNVVTLMGLDRDTGEDAGRLAGTRPGQGPEDAPGNDTGTVRHGRPLWYRVSAMAAAMILALFTGASLTMLHNGSDWATDRAPTVNAETDLGQQRRLVLTDGSTVHVNTRSQVVADLQKDARLVTLIGGEAFFNVAPDPDRPFRVIAGETVIEAVGTAFNVRFIDGEATVAVSEGTVAVGNTAAPDAVSPGQDAGTDTRILLSVGETAHFTAQDTSPVISTANPDTIAAWRARQLVFEGDDLTTIAAEFNRYNRVKLVIVGDTLGKKRYSGVFNSDDPASFIAFLELTGTVTTERTGDTLTIRQAGAE